MLNFFELLLRIYSFAFHLALSAFLIGSAALAYRSHLALNLDMIPFDPDVLLRNTLLLGLAGSFCTLLSLTRFFKFVFFLWTGLAVYLMIKGFFFSDYSFDSSHQARAAVYLSLGCLATFFGAWWSLKTRKGKSMF